MIRIKELVLKSLLASLIAGLVTMFIFGGKTSAYNSQWIGALVPLFAIYAFVISFVANLLYDLLKIAKKRKNVGS